MDIDQMRVMHCIQVAHHILIAALLRTHPNYNAAQLQLTAMLEQQLAGGSLCKDMTEAEKDLVRQAVEWTQMVRPAAG